MIGREKVISNIYKNLFLPLTANWCETVHELTIDLLAKLPAYALSAIAREFEIELTNAPIEVMGLKFPWPGIIMAAGMDKKCISFGNMANVFGIDGFEAGTVTPTFRPGNPKSRTDSHGNLVNRVIRYPDGTIINWQNFPGPGVEQAVQNFDQQKRICQVPAGISVVESPQSHTHSQIMADVELLVSTVYPHHPDWISYDPSCPNGILDEKLRLEKMDTMCQVISGLMSVASQNAEKNGFTIPILIKLGPDLNAEELATTVETIIDSGVTGIIATNTTSARTSKYGHIPSGGLSGPLLYPKSLAMVREIRKLDNQHQLVLIGCGGIDSGEKVIEMKTAGADLIQVLSGFIFGGPYFFKQLKRELIC